jgi:hypothetical protein
MPSGPSGSRRHGPARATAPITAAQQAAMPYSQTAGCGSSHHETRLARYDPAGTAQANTPASRHSAARRRRRSGWPPRRISPIAANATTSASA